MRFKRVRLTKKTPRHLVCKVPQQPIPDERGQDPVRDASSGHGRVVARKVHGNSSPGSRLGKEGIG